MRSLRRTLGVLVPVLALAAALAGVSCGAARRSYPAIAGHKQVALHIHVIGSGGYDPHVPTLQTDYMALAVPSDGGHYLARQGDEQWFTWSAFFPKDFPTQRGWGVFAAWKGLGLGFNSTPNVWLDVTDDVLHLYVAGGNPDVIKSGGSIRFEHNPSYGPRYQRSFVLGPLRKGVWQTFYLHVRWSHAPDGLVELYRAIDGGRAVRILAPKRVANLYDDWPAVRYPIQDLYHKGGEANLGTVSDLYQTPMQWGPSLAAALTTPSRQIADGRWFGDTKSKGELVPISALPVAPPRRVLAPGASGSEERPNAKPKAHPTAKPAPSRAGRAEPARGHALLDPGCSRCSVRVASAGISASIAGGGDRDDTAVWTKALAPERPLEVSDRVQLASAKPLDGNLAILQVRDRSGKVLYEIYVAPDRSLHLWSPAGSLRAAVTNLSLGVSIPSFGERELPLSISLAPRRSLVVRVDGKLRLRVPARGARSARAASLRVGIDHYDGSPGNLVAVAHRGLAAR